MAQTMTAGLDAGCLGIPLHLFLDALRGEWTRGALLIPEHQPTGYGPRPCGQAGAEGRQRGGGDIDDTILAAFPLFNPSGLLLPVNVTQCEVSDFAHASATAQHQQTQGMIHGVHNLGKERADLLLRELLRQRATSPQEMGRLDRIDG